MGKSWGKSWENIGTSWENLTHLTMKWLIFMVKSRYFGNFASQRKDKIQDLLISPC